MGHTVKTHGIPSHSLAASCLMMKPPLSHSHAGLSRQEVISAPFWDTFALTTSFPLEEVQQRAALNKEFALSNVVMRNAELCMTSAVESAQPALRVFTMDFRWGP